MEPNFVEDHFFQNHFCWIRLLSLHRFPLVGSCVSLISCDAMPTPAHPQQLTSWRLFGFEVWNATEFRSSIWASMVSFPFLHCFLPSNQTKHNIFRSIGKLLCARKSSSVQTGASSGCLQRVVQVQGSCSCCKDCYNDHCYSDHYRDLSNFWFPSSPCNFVCVLHAISASPCQETARGWRRSSHNTSYCDAAVPPEGSDVGRSE